MMNSVSPSFHQKSIFPSRLVTEGNEEGSAVIGELANEPVDEVASAVPVSSEREMLSPIKVMPEAGDGSLPPGFLKKLALSGMAALTFFGAIAGATASAAVSGPPSPETAGISRDIQEDAGMLAPGGGTGSEGPAAPRSGEIQQPLAENPSSREIKALLESSAKKHGVPREIVLAVAWHESGWKHYDEDGSLVMRENFNRKGKHVSTDWGIMQINDRAHPDAFPRAKNDIKYNIDFGAGLLKSLYRENGSWNKAIRAYNGSGAYVKKITRVMNAKPWQKGKPIAKLHK
jgi:hypothetical protein